MSKLEELINRLCPDGVEYRKLDDLLSYEQPSKYIVEKTDYLDKGTPVLTAGQSFILGYTDETKGVFEASKDNPVIIFDDFTTSFHWVDFDFKVKSSAMKMLRNKIEGTTLRYVYYNLQTINYQPVEHSRQWIGTYSQFEIPLPPLQVQEEIVRILDTFTELETELEVELETRRKQYEYYKNLFFMNNKIPRVIISDVVFTYIGLVTTMTKHYADKGVPLIFNSSIKENRFEFDKMVYLDEPFAIQNDNRRHKIDDVITVHTGDIGTSAIITEDLDGSLGFATIVSRIKDRSILLPRYLCYYLNSHQNKNSIEVLSKSDRNNLNLKDFNRLTIPLPSITEQKYVVSVLDSFNTICNDITQGLPKEIGLRRKQYEYYRDKLLTFKRKEVV